MLSEILGLKELKQSDMKFMNWAIYTWFALEIFGLGVALAKHGEERTINFFSTLLGAVISIGLLYLGGAFSNL